MDDLEASFSSRLDQVASGYKDIHRTSSSERMPRVQPGRSRGLGGLIYQLMFVVVVARYIRRWLFVKLRIFCLLTSPRLA